MRGYDPAPRNKIPFLQGESLSACTTDTVGIQGEKIQICTTASQKISWEIYVIMFFL